jgi:hypothetical protein
MNGTTPPDYTAIANKILNLIGGPVEIDTPQLGRVGFPRPAELYQALNYIRMAQAQAAGTATAGVFVAQYDRGLWPITRSL